ncbi:hypothetical protein [Yersinia phage PY100]|nr:hypothetical protein [Yersinia phage PY100]
MIRLERGFGSLISRLWLAVWGRFGAHAGFAGEIIKN